MKNLLILMSVLVVASACEKTIPLDLSQVNSGIAIDGQVTNYPGYQYVKITRSVDYYTNGPAPRVTNATVMVEDDLGNVHHYIHNPNNHADSVGYYVPEVPFLGEVNRTYKLTVVADGQTYEATDKLMRVPLLDKLEIGIDEDEREDPEDDGRFYEVLYFVKEPQDTKDYYLFKSFRNGKLERSSDSDVYYADDELVGENIDGLPAPIFYAENDKARVEVFSLSREAFIFYRDLSKVLNSDGGMFSPPGAAPRTNLSNGAYGFFKASAITYGEIDVKMD